MLIMIGADTYPPTVSGAGRFTHRLATGMVGRGHEVHVVCPSVTGQPSITSEDGVVVHRLVSHPCLVHDRIRICLPWQIAGTAGDLVRRLRPDVIHVQSHFPVGRALARAASASGTPLVATNHFMPENVVGHLPVPGPLRRRIARWSWSGVERVFARADLVTAPTPRAAALLQHSTTLTGVVPISCGVDIDRYASGKRAGSIRPRVPSVLFAGRLDEEKRVGDLIRAMAALPAGLAARLDIVGDGRQRAPWAALAARLGLTDRVVFHGFVPDSALAAVYAACDVFCMPGVAELQSLVTLEAMAAARPIVAADAMALPHLVRPGRNGWLFRPGDVADLADKLRLLLIDPELRDRMGTASRDLVAAHGEAATLDAFGAAYEQVRADPAPVFARAA